MKKPVPKENAVRSRPKVRDAMTANSLPRERHGHRRNGPTLNVYGTHFHRYRHLWDSLAATDSNAWYFSDGSASESELRQRGTALASRIRYAIDVGKRH